MSKFSKINGGSMIVGCTSLFLTAFAGQAMAQDYYLDITRVKGVSVDVEYASIKKQIDKYCRKEAPSRAREALSVRHHMIEDCKTQLMDNFLDNAADRRLLAYDRKLKSGTVMMAKDQKTAKKQL